MASNYTSIYAPVKQTTAGWKEAGKDEYVSPLSRWYKDGKLGYLGNIEVMGPPDAWTMAQRASEAYQTAENEAKAANESRYQQILAGYDTLGQQGRKDIDQQYKNMSGTGYASLVNRGLAGTTIAPTMMAGYAKAANADRSRLTEALAAQKYGFMERRTDTYPDLGQFASLIQGLAALSSAAPKTNTFTTEKYNSPTGYAKPLGW